MSAVLSPQSARTMLAQPSLKSKESAVSVGSPGSLSGRSTNGEGRAASDPDIVETVHAPQVEEHDLKHKNKLKRGAEKVLSLIVITLLPQPSSSSPCCRYCCRCRCHCLVTATVVVVTPLPLLPQVPVIATGIMQQNAVLGPGVVASWRHICKPNGPARGGEVDACFEP
ncbi:hypothetical protein EDB84DRAFT_1440777 [Lactarius hengduanensis]|nr:hypothetical protein EDB84DRAFT_1440777 [Lactarius hengduanensis]